MQDHHKAISTQGHCCPMPLVLVTRAISEMQKGQVLMVTGDDPLFEAGMIDFCEARKLKFLGVLESENSTTIWIEI
jgi:TusA-related sulfurtransferase